MSERLRAARARYQAQRRRAARRTPAAPSPAIPAVAPQQQQPPDPFAATRAQIRAVGFASVRAYRVFARLPTNTLPLRPDRHFGARWTSWQDFLGPSYTPPPPADPHLGGHVGLCRACKKLLPETMLVTRRFPLVEDPASATLRRFASPHEVATAFLKCTKCQACWNKNRFIVSQ